MLFMIPLPALQFIFDSCSMTYLGLKTRGQRIYLDASFDVNIKPIFRGNVLDSMVPIRDFNIYCLLKVLCHARFTEDDMTKPL